MIRRILRLLDEIMSQSDGMATDRREFSRAQLCVAVRTVESSADGSRPHVYDEEVLRSPFESTDSVIDHRGVCIELLPQGHRDGILIFGTPHLQDVGKFRSLFPERLSQDFQGRCRLVER